MKKINIQIFGLFFGVLVIVSSCTERFRPELTDFENNLVVDGKITNEEGPYTIRLSLSSDLDLVRYTPLKNASVIIQEENGPSERLVEVSSGEYQTSKTGIRGEVGKRYQLQIESPDGRVYESNFQQLIAPTPIENVYTEIESKFFTEDNADAIGLQFYVDAGSSPNEQDYFLWLSDATFKYRAEYPIEATYQGFDLPFPKPDSLSVCWRKDTVNQVTTYNTGDYADPAVKKIPLHFIKSTDISLSERYSPLVKQYTVNKEAYEFWQSIEAQLNTDANLYSTQPYQTRGNIKNINQPDEAVLGFFLVAGVSEKRIFVNAPTNLPLYEAACFYDYEGYGWRWAEPATTYPIYIARGPEGLALAPNGCLDCRDHGGTIIEPDFWED